jgi:hypothetical protein
MATNPIPTRAPKKVRQPGRFRSLLGYVLLGRGTPDEIVIYSHSNLFYWWPVWLTGFILAGITYYADDNRLAIVPPDTVAARNREVEVEPGRLERRDVLIVPKDRHLVERPGVDGNPPEVEQPRFRVAHSKNLGIIFVLVLLLVVALTNIPLRGLWSVVIIMVVVMGSIILVQTGWWGMIVGRYRLLSIHINMAGYLLISITLFILWLVNFLFFDRQIYLVFSPGQARVRTQIGGGETVYDTTGMVFQKQRSDLFRHWILGFGSGDLVVRPGGGKEHLDLPNVMHVGHKVRAIEQRIKEKEIIAG